MPSLNQVASQIGSRINRPFNDMLKGEIKDLFLSELALLVRRTINSSGIDRQYVASFTCTLRSVDEADNNIKVQGTSVLRSVNRIPTPIRYDSPVPFIYVGTINGKLAFGYLNNYGQEFVADLPLIGNKITYDHIDNYIYIYDQGVSPSGAETFPILTTSDAIKIIAPYIDYRLIKDQMAGGRGIEYNDDMELPYPLDLINTCITSILQGPLGGLDSKDKIEASHLDNQ